MASNSDDATAQHVARTLRALEFLAEGPQAQAALARRLGVHRRTARRLLGRLVAEGYAEEVGSERRAGYAATPRLVVLGRRVADGLDLVAIAWRHLHAITSDCASARFLAVPQEGGLRVARFEDLGAASTNDSLEPTEATWPLHATAAGKIFLSADASLAGDVLNQELLAFTPRTLVARADLLLELARVRADGYAVEDAEHRPGMRAVASGALNHAGVTVAAIGAVPLPAAEIAPLGDRVREVAIDLSRELGAAVD
jgi:IclR family acetate operon transcriptional repressor